MVVGITRSRDEADIIESSIRRMLEQVDRIVIGDNSDDGTREILDALAVEHPGRVDVRWDDAPSVAQRDVMTQYARDAAADGAEWVVPFDIDEVWQSDRATIRHRLASLGSEILLAPARLVTHCCTTLDDQSDPDPLSRMVWRDVEMLPLPKMACRARPDVVIEHGNHGARFERVKVPPAALGLMSARHFPYRSAEQFIHCVEIAWPQLRDSGLPETHGAHIWAYGRTLDERGPDGLRAVFNEHWLVDAPAQRGRVHDPLPRVRLSLTA